MKTYRIETGRLIIRCWEPRDAAALKEAVDSSIEHLRPWLPWVRFEPQTIDEKVELLRGFRARYDRDEDYILGIFDRDDRTVLGGTGLHTRRGPNEREIGYWVRANAASQGIVSEAVAALVHAAFSIENVVRLEIRCDPKNRPSVRVAEKALFNLDGTLPRRAQEGDGELRDTMVFSLYPEDDRPSLSGPISAFDAAGRPLSL